MRVIAGSLGGRLFDSPGSTKTHPMSDKARGALFNILGDIDNLRVLDAFAGTGALSFEAVSRGAASAVAIEQDKPAQRVITSNIAALRLDGQVQLIKATADAWLATNPDAMFDLVLCDPPYHDLQRNLLDRLSQRLTPAGILVLSWPSGTPLPEFDHLKKLDQRSYGDLVLAFWGNFR